MKTSYYNNRLPFHSLEAILYYSICVKITEITLQQRKAKYTLRAQRPTPMHDVRDMIICAGGPNKY